MRVWRGGVVGKTGEKKEWERRNGQLAHKSEKAETEATNYRKKMLTAPAPPKLFSWAQVGLSDSLHQVPVASEGRRPPAFRKKPFRCQERQQSHSTGARLVVSLEE